MTDLRELKLLPKWQAYLIKGGFTTVDEILSSTPAQIQAATRLPQAEVDQLLDAVCRRALELEAPARRVSELVQDDGDENVDGEQKARGTMLTTGDARLDVVFGGGIACGSLTELVGEAGAGKTNLSLQLALTCQLSSDRGGLDGGCIYVASEGSGPRLSSRLAAIAPRFFPEQPGQSLGNVHFISCPDAAMLERALEYSVPGQARNLARNPQLKNVRLIIIDSIAACMREASATGSSLATTSLSLVERAKAYARIGATLRRLAYRLDAAVVIVNQVSGGVGIRANALHEDPPSSLPSRPPSSSSMHSQGTVPPSRLTGELLSSPAQSSRAHLKFGVPPLLYSRVQEPFFSGTAITGVRSDGAALGLSWASELNARVVLSRASSLPGSAPTEERTTMRQATAVFGPHMAREARARFVIDENGLSGVDAAMEPEAVDALPNVEDEYGWFDDGLDDVELAELIPA